MKTNADTNFSTINSEIALYVPLLILAYQEFTDMRWEVFGRHYKFCLNCFPLNA